MIVHVILVENKSLQLWDLERFTAHCDFPACEASSQDGDAALEHVKGAALCAIGMFSKVPNRIEFKVKREVQEG